MIDFIKKIFGFGKKVDFKSLVQNGGQMIDVRTATEYNNGHIRNSINIPLQELNEKIIMLDKTRPIITCCASGVRSESAKNILKSKGFEVYNGGGWQSLQNKIQS